MIELSWVFNILLQRFDLQNPVLLKECGLELPLPPPPGGCGRGGCPLPCCVQRRSLLFGTLFDCEIYIVGNAIMSATGTATFY